MVKLNNQLQGYTMAILGLVFLLYNALSYIFGWESRSSAFTILGLVFVVIGMKRARKNYITLFHLYAIHEK